ncbi:MAG: hypothetical protein FJ298_14690 [Planctomycetes bacterium]|nr:hypothetical protein [Planctomycetota bacterium]
MKLALAPLLALLAALAPQDAELAARKQRWSELLALDLPRAVLAELEPQVLPGAPLGRDGAALALWSRAVFATHEPAFESAWSRLERRDVDPATRADLELERARLLVESDQLARALGALLDEPRAPVPRFADRPASWLLVGRAWFRSGEPERGAPFLSKFVELAPRDRETCSALHLLAQAALARGDGATAQACVRRAEELSRWHALWNVRARQVLEKPDERLPRLGLAQLWLQAGDTRRARTELRALLERHLDCAPGWFLLGEAQRFERDLEGALASYSKALEWEPTHLLALNNRATIHRLEGRLAEARADFERLVDGPRGCEAAALPALLALARTLADLGDESAAAQRYARYRELGGREPLVEVRR